MSRRLLVPVILLAAIATFPTRSEACDCCCDYTHKHQMVLPRYALKGYTYQGDFPYEIGATGGGKGTVIGLGAELDGPIAKHWHWMVDGGYGIGDVKSTSTSGTNSSTFETKLTNYSVEAGLDYGHHGGWHCGPGVEWISTRPTLKQTGFADLKPSAFNLYGFDAHLSGNIPVNRSFSLFGEDREFIGYGHFKDTFTGPLFTQKAETKGYFSVNTWQGGLQYRFE